MEGSRRNDQSLENASIFNNENSPIVGEPQLVDQFNVDASEPSFMSMLLDPSPVRDMPEMNLSLGLNNGLSPDLNLPYQWDHDTDMTMNWSVNEPELTVNQASDQQGLFNDMEAFVNPFYEGGVGHSLISDAVLYDDDPVYMVESDHPFGAEHSTVYEPVYDPTPLAANYSLCPIGHAMNNSPPQMVETTYAGRMIRVAPVELPSTDLVLTTPLMSASLLVSDIVPAPSAMSATPRETGDLLAQTSESGGPLATPLVVAEDDSAEDVLEILAPPSVRYHRPEETREFIDYVYPQAVRCSPDDLLTLQDLPEKFGRHDQELFEYQRAPDSFIEYWERGTLVNQIRNDVFYGFGVHEIPSNPLQADMLVIISDDDEEDVGVWEILNMQGLQEEMDVGLTEEQIVDNMMSIHYAPPETKTWATFCGICLEEYVKNEDRLGVLDCGHDYHYDCIMTWLVLKNTCPFCRETGLAHVW